MYAKRKKFPLIPFAAIGLIVGILLIAVVAAPRVVDISPDGRDLSSTSRITLEFNQPMDRASVESRLKITPFSEGRLSWDGNRLLIEPGQPWRTDERVEVHLGAGARSRRMDWISMSSAASAWMPPRRNCMKNGRQWKTCSDHVAGITGTQTQTGG